ncbi:MAG TPA: FlgD immunoglobulin-like domain containing protein, partial [Bacteroidota bacterium]
LGHDLAETAVDILLKRQLDDADVPLGAMLMQSARKRPAEILDALKTAYAQETAMAIKMPLGQVVKTIVAGEKSWKETITQYGGLFTQEESVVKAQLAAANAPVASQYLSYYLKDKTGYEAQVNVTAADVIPMIDVAIAAVSDSWEAELEGTITFTAKGLEDNKVQTCTSGVALGKENAQPETVAPNHFSLDGNYPNPFNPSTTIAFRLPVDAPVSLEIYNILGQKVRTLLDNAPYGSGAWTVVWDGKNDAGALLPSGAYLCRLSSPAGTMTRKLAMMK